MITRRQMTGALLVGPLVGVMASAVGAREKKPGPLSGHAKTLSQQQIEQKLAQIEADVGGRLGVALFDTSTGLQAGIRIDERFPMCSTFKFLAAAAVLTRKDKGEEHLERIVHFSAADLVDYSPVTSTRVGGAGMSMAELCEAAITQSDNTAGNLLLASLGGPAGFTAFARSLGDGVTRLDRIETELNEAIPGDPRDTTTPAAMLNDMRELLLGNHLSAASSDQLKAWLLANKTGDTRVRAKLPEGWKVGDKTGSGEQGSTNDIAIIWPPQRPPILVTIYLTETRASPEQRNAAIAEIGALISSIAS